MIENEDGGLPVREPMFRATPPFFVVEKEQPEQK